MNIENEKMKEVRYQETLALLEDKMRQSTNAYHTVSMVLNTIVEVVHAEAGTLWFYDRFGSGAITPRAACGRVLLDTALLSLGEGVAGKVVQTGKAVIVPDCQNDPRWAGKVDAKTGFTTKSMLCVPLVVKGKVFGCIQIINKKDNSAYDEEDLKLVSKLAQGISTLFLRYGLLGKKWAEALGDTTTSAVGGKNSQKEKGNSSRESLGANGFGTSDHHSKDSDDSEHRSTVSSIKKIWRVFGGKK